MEQQRSIRTIHFATFDLDLQTGELRKSGVKIRLPRQSFKVLARLLEHPGEPSGLPVLEFEACR